MFKINQNMRDKLPTLYVEDPLEITRMTIYHPDSNIFWVVLFQWKSP
jgi:hypothetical protein